MKKKIVIGGSIILVGALLLYAVNVFNKETVKISEITTEKGNDGGTIIEIEEERKETVEQEFPMDMGENAVQDAIHGMSHQKVSADKKWYFVPLTGERVDRLIEVVKANEPSYEHSSLYLDILTRWQNNNFSQVDVDHNNIWKLNNGNVGKATGILSPEEEREFIESHYNVE